MSSLSTPISWSCAMRWSYSAKGWIGFFAPLRDGRQLLRRELVFTGLSEQEFADLFKESLREWQIDRVLSIVGNQEMFPSESSTGPTVSEALLKLGLPMRPGESDREAGWMRLRAWLQLLRRVGSPRFTPSLLIHPDCDYFIKTLEMLISDPTDPDDVIETVDEYPARAAAMWAMARPAPKAEQPKKPMSPNSWHVQIELDKHRWSRSSLGSDLNEQR